MGKTMLLEKMERQQPNSHHERRGLTLRPVLRVQMPSSPDERRFYTRLLEVLGAPYTSHDQIGALEGRVLHILAEIGTKLLCIDEVHHLLAGSQREQRRALSLLKFVANELKIAVVAVGTQDAFHAMQIDSQVASRFEPLLLPRWTEIDGFRGFVTGYGRPVCPPPHGDESLHSWFERVAAYYGLSPHRMLSTVARGLPKPRDWSDAFKGRHRPRCQPQSCASANCLERPLAIGRRKCTRRRPTATARLAQLRHGAQIFAPMP
jgi:hypothetical protein